MAAVPLAFIFPRAMVESTAAIIPAYNAERFLARALDSVLAQTRRVDQVVVVDDASSDGTVALARSYGERGHPVVVLTGGPNAGPGSARNRGLQYATADTVLFLDADDTWLPEHCATVVEALERHRTAAFAHTFVAGTPLTGPDGARLDRGAILLRSSVWPLLYHSDVPQSAVAARRATLLSVGGYGDGRRHAEDYDLWLRLALVAPYAEVRAVTFERGIHAGQATHNAPAMFRGAWEARHQVRAFAVEHGIAIETARWGEVLRWAYERDLGWAWQSRSWRALDAVLALHGMVPDGDEIHRTWRRRARYVWPFWRIAAFGWDAIPGRFRAELRRCIWRPGCASEFARRGVAMREKSA